RVSAQSMYEDLQTDLRPDLAKIATPITVLVPWTAERGGEGPVLDLYKQEYAGAPKVTVQGVGDSGHFIMLDQPEAFRTALTAWLAG
ncbi:MAG TPA: alpha/beta hydrolase, partial [Sphingomonas sp.]|nr:alpha/beta hydrolase [Sphingomonas sp.]